LIRYLNIVKSPKNPKIMPTFTQKFTGHEQTNQNLLFNLRLAKTREYGIEGRYNRRGSSYHMIMHALQTGTPFE